MRKREASLWAPAWAMKVLASIAVMYANLSKWKKRGSGKVL
jgi:hypothetical protein